ncbi:MAG: methionyl-tRNA formyltransferase [Candidatus Saccharimonadales bacterium]
MSETIIFFGSGPVAAKSLELLLKNFKVEAVVTKPRPQHHKGSVPVLDIASAHKLKVFTARNKAELTNIFRPKPFKSRLAILIDFGIIVPQSVIDYFPLGIVNSHFSLLPEWRGADPITFAILSGQDKTGVSLMLLTAGMDEGPLLSQVQTDITAGMTTPELTEVLVNQSYAALCETLPPYFSGQIVPAPQEAVTLAKNRTPTYSRRLTKDDGVIDWKKPAAEIEREIRAFADWPQSRTNFGGLDVILTKTHILELSGKPGTRIIIDKNPVVFCGAVALAIDGIKPAGKKEMSGRAFLAGYKTVFSS